MYQTFVKPLFLDIKTFVLDTLFPIRCLACEKEGKKFICNECKPLLTSLEGQICIVCHKPSLGGLTHPKCTSTYCADGLISFFDYHDQKVADILIKGKYSFLPNAYNELGLFLAEKIKSDFPHLLSPMPFTLTPIPLHKRRLRWRGFNQSEVLAQVIASALRSPCASVLVRCKSTKTQKDLKKERRIKNVSDAFALNIPLFSTHTSLPLAGRDRERISLPAGRQGEVKNPIENQNFILIDDVTTTGSTLLEAAKVLKRNGAAKVWCLTIARD